MWLWLCMDNNIWEKDTFESMEELEEVRTSSFLTYLVWGMLFYPV
jgi:hypothetical protein